MRIYYFGELIADTNETVPTVPASEAAATKKTSHEPRLIRDILTERPYAQRSATSIKARASRTFGPAFLPQTFTIRNYAHA